MDSRLYLRAAPLVLLLVVAIFAPLIVAILGLPHPGTVDFHALGPLSLPVGPSSAHPFGVDNLGRDVLARVLFGARTALGEVLVATASGLVIAIPAFGFFYFLRNRGVKILHDIQDIMASLLRKMPYEKLEGAQIGNEELYAADPEWWQAAKARTGESPA